MTKVISVTASAVASLLTGVLASGSASAEPVTRPVDALSAETPADAPAEPPQEAAYKPRRFEAGGVVLETPVSFAERLDLVTPIAMDAEGNEFRNDAAFNVRVRVGARFSTEKRLAPVRLVGEWEHDIVSGIHRGGATAATQELTTDAPNSGGTTHALRRAQGQVDITQYVHLIGGRMTSHWGLGLMANDGAHGWKPGSAQFVSPRDGDQMLRGMAMVGPFTEHAITVMGGYDVPKADDVLRPGDKARQFFAGAMYGFGSPTNAGVYVVSRKQWASRDDDETNVIAIDAAGGHTFDLPDDLKIRLDGELALIVGNTTFGSSPDFAEHDVRQMGWQFRLGVAKPKFGFVFDAIYASGDDNAEDGVQAGFRADPNAEFGLVTFRYLQGALSSRQVQTAFNPDLSGLPSEDLDRISTRGQVTNTLAFFPKLWGEVCEGFEIYGGPMIAIAPKFPTDPYHTRIAGGDPRNSYNGKPGKLWGIEFDLGTRYRTYWAGTQLDLGAEGGVLLPGSATKDLDGKALAPIVAGRVFVEYAL